MRPRPTAFAVDCGPLSMAWRSLECTAEGNSLMNQRIWVAIGVAPSRPRATANAQSTVPTNRGVAFAPGGRSIAATSTRCALASCCTDRRPRAQESVRRRYGRAASAVRRRYMSPRRRKRARSRSALDAISCGWRPRRLESLREYQDYRARLDGGLRRYGPIPPGSCVRGRNSRFGFVDETTFTLAPQQANPRSRERLYDRTPGHAGGTRALFRVSRL